jgi:hypothetical protein
MDSSWLVRLFLIEAHAPNVNIFLQLLGHNHLSELPNNNKVPKNWLATSWNIFQVFWEAFCVFMLAYCITFTHKWLAILIRHSTPLSFPVFHKASRWNNTMRNAQTYYHLSNLFLS